jgi:hypothetical protein
MNWRKLLPFLLAVAPVLRLSAQLPNGSTAPDFIAQDIFGQTHHLYQLLEQGKIVVLEISATWCPPCWVYHNSGAMQELYEAHGPAGDNKLQVLWVEGDPGTNLNCLYGPSGCNGGSTGNYVAGTPYPIIDNAAIAAAYQITYYPSIFIICPNKKTYEIDPVDADALWNAARQCPVAYGVNNAGIFQYSPGTELRELCGNQELSPHFQLTNLGSTPLTQASIALEWNNNTIQNLEWNGYLPTYGEALVTFPYQSLSNVGALKTTVTSINNGASDDDFSNNSRTDNFTVAPQFNTTEVLLRIRTDSYGEETYWEVRDDFGNVLEQGGNSLVGPNGGGAYPLGVPKGPGSYADLAIIRDTLHLPANGCYSIHFSDGFGDGMCCDYGTGYFRLYDLDNPSSPLISGGTFEDYARRGFGAGVVSDLQQPEALIRLDMFPNPAVDRLNIDLEAPAGVEISGHIFNALGQLQYRLPVEKSQTGGNDYQLSLAGWPEGVYYLQIRWERSMATRTFVVRRP